MTYTVKDALGLTSNTATLDLRVGPPVSFAGVVYVDTNDNGVQDSGEVGIGGVTITLTKTNGPVTFSLTATTAADGSYSFAETEGMNVLPAGTYTLTETPPIYFVDGKDTPGMRGPPSLRTSSPESTSWPDRPRRDSTSPN